MCLDKKRDWFAMFDATDWKEHHKDKGIDVFVREGPRGILQMKATGIIDAAPLSIFRLLCDSKERLIYDVNIAESRVLEKFAANCYHQYQRSKAKAFIISSRDFCLSQMHEKVSQEL